MERSFGASFHDVRVHPESNTAALGAIAYTQGSHIHFAPGRYDTSSASGRALLGHELTHVLQRRAGRVRAPQAKGAPVNVDRALEAEADDLGFRAARGEAARVPGSAAGAHCGPGVIQRAVGFEVECQDWFTAHSYVDLDDEMLQMPHNVKLDVHERDHLGGGGLMPDPTMPEVEKNPVRTRPSTGRAAWARGWPP